MATLSSLILPGDVLTDANTATLTNKTIGDDLKFADADESNWVAFQAPATIASNITWTLPDADGTDGQVMKTNGSGTLSWSDTAPENGYLRNRIINGDMRIDQRNAGAAVNTSGAFPVDRFQYNNTTDGVCSCQQDSSAPVGFINSTKITTTTEDASLTTTQQASFKQAIEGTNIADLGWGTANAKTITLSFWVRSSLTGTFGGALKNSGANRSYPFTYTISVADTWEYKTVTVAGDTSGTWLTTTGEGIDLRFSLGAGPDRSGTAGAWNANNNTSATGATSVIGTLNATWYITGVQLEVGSVATPFERRPYGTELALCQRYYQKITNGVTDNSLGVGFYYTSSHAIAQIPFQTYMRATPTLDVNTGSNYFILYTNGAGDSMDTVSLNDANPYTAAVANTSQVSGTAGMAGQFKTNNASASLAFSAEL